MADQPRPKTGIQKLSQNLFARSDEQRAAMELESRSWMVQCPYCGYQRSVWDMGGIKYKASGTSRQLRKCSNCGRVAWHRVYKSAEPSPAGIAMAPVDRIRFSRPLMWAVGIGLLIATIACFLAILLFFLNSALQPVVVVGDTFMSSLKKGNYSEAYALCTLELQRELGGASGLRALAQEHQPVEWNWNSRRLRNGTGYLDGSFSYANRSTGLAHLVLNQVGNDWRISGFRMDSDNP